MNQLFLRASGCAAALALIAAALLVAGPASAATTTQIISGVTYTLDDAANTASVTDYDHSAASVTIESSVGSYPVTSIGVDAFRVAYEDTTSTKLSSVSIPGSILAIEDGAFQNNALNPIAIPGSVITIGAFAFADNDLTTLTLPDSVLSVGAFSFFANKLTTLDLGESIVDIGGTAFSGHLQGNGTDNNIGSVVIPNSVITIGDGAFQHLNNLTEVVLGDSVETLGEYAFGFSYNLESISIPDSVTTIGPYAFAVSGRLSELALGSGVSTIAAGAFQQTALTSVSIPNSVTEIGDFAFAYGHLTSVSIGASVSSIGNQAFSNQSDFMSHEFVNDLTSVSFAGNAPTVFTAGSEQNQGSLGFSTGLTVSYFSDRTGFTNPWQGYATTPVVRDVTAPTVTIDGGAFVTTLDLTPAITGTTGEAAGTTVTVALGDQTLTTTATGTGTWAISPTVTAGSYTISASVTDEAGNTGTATQSLRVNSQNPAALPPASTTAELETFIVDNSLDSAATSAAFIATGATVGNPLDSLDTSEPFSGNLPWSDPTDSFVDVYAYSSPTLLGTFPVVNGMVIINGVNLAALSTGAHHLVLIGQTSGAVSVLNITVQPAPGTGTGTGTGTTAAAASTSATSTLAGTGVNASAPIGSALALVLLGAVLLLNRRRTATQY